MRYAMILVTLASVGCASTGPLIVLLTDFGPRGSYVGSLKGAIYRECPEARIDSITHDVPAFDVAAGARILREAAPEYPPGTIFVAVVDPGVGTDRMPIAARSQDGKYFIGPDNGLLAPVLDALGMDEIREIRVDGERSATFHGRDIFGPAAGRLGRGEDLASLGPTRGVIIGRVELPVPGVVEIDTYGNIITNISLRKVPRAEHLRIRIAGKEVDCPWVKTYGDVPEGDLLCLENSQGFLEIAVNQGHAGECLQAIPGSPVEIIRP